MAKNIIVRINVKKMKMYPEKVNQAIKIGMKKGALEVERKAKMYSPVDTGTLRRSISVDNPVKKTFDGWTISVSPKVNYGIFMERPGNVRRHGRRPYMVPALQDSVNKIKMHLFREIGRIK